MGVLPAKTRLASIVRIIPKLLDLDGQMPHHCWPRQLRADAQRLSALDAI
jgi:hypothetical protein